MNRNVLISNVPKGGRVHVSVRDEYEFYWCLLRMYKRWRQPEISSICNIVFNALSAAQGGHEHYGNRISTCANESLRARDYPALLSSYIPAGSEVIDDDD